MTTRAPVAEWQALGDPRAHDRVRQLLNMSSGLRFAAPARATRPSSR